MAWTVTALAVATVGLQDAAMAHEGHGRAKLSEAELFRLETAMLGREHALEHAAERRVYRQSRARRATTKAHGHGGTGQRWQGRIRWSSSTVRRTLLAAGPASEVGRWLPGFTVPGVAINAALLPTGKVLYYPGRLFSFTGSERAYVWDRTKPIAAGSNPRLVTPPSPAGWTIFCGGTSFLPNGDALITGGQSQASQDKGAPLVMTFDPFTETWTRRADMADGRWYPGQTPLPSGVTAILSGKTLAGSANTRIEVSAPATATTRVVATRGVAGAPPGGGNFPHLTTLASGRTLVSGPDPVDSW